MKTILATVVTATVVVLLAPAKVDGYGAIHYGYTHVGPYGAYHAGATGYGAGYGGNAWRGGGYWAGIRSGEAGIAQTHWAAATHGYTYFPDYWGPYPYPPYPPYPPGPYGPFYLR